MDDGCDYAVHTNVRFRLDFDGTGEFNLLLLPSVCQEFARHVKKIYEQDGELSGYISGDLNFRFDGCWADLEYTFSCHDENKAEAESFSACCVRQLRQDLEGFGCQLTDITCRAEEADMTWLDQLEDTAFNPAKQPGQGGMEMC